MHNNSSFYLLIPCEQYVGDGTTSLCKHDLQVLHRVAAVCKLYSESSEAKQRDFNIPRVLLLLVNDTWILLVTKANWRILTVFLKTYLYYANVHNYLLRAKQENYFQMLFIFIFGVIPMGPRSTCIQLGRVRRVG